MSLSADQLFALLPAVYRDRDALNGGPLEAIFSILAAQAGIVEDNIQQLYDDQFIETCASWVIPYIGDLLGYNSIYEVTGASFDSRAEVANTISYRRRKGTLIALEQLTMDVSGRASMVVEEFKRLITTESMRHVRARHKATVSVRRLEPWKLEENAFEHANYNVDVRRIAPRTRVAASPDATPLDIALHGPGRFNIPDIAIHLWRLRSWPVRNAPVVSSGEGCYLFSPFGFEMPLFSQPAPRDSFERLTGRIDVPQPIGRMEFRDSLADANAPQFYGPGASVLLIADGMPVDGSMIRSANLTGSQRCNVPHGCIAVDPQAGRIQYADDLELPLELRVNYSYGFAGEIGGGPYDRSASLSSLKPAQVELFAVVGSLEYPTVSDAVVAWNMLAPGASGIIVLPAFERHAIDLTEAGAIELPAGSSLTIASGVPIPQGGPLDVVWNNACATLIGNMEVRGTIGRVLLEGEIEPAGSLLLSGVWIAGQITLSGLTSNVQLMDSTLVPGLALNNHLQPVAPGEPSVIVTAAEASLSLVRCVCGPVAANAGGSARICSSIVDATSPCCVAYAAPDMASAGADLHIEDSTVIGKVHARTLPLASNTLFYAHQPRRDPWAAPVWISRKQTGCVRFCWLPFNSITPRRYECLPPGSDTQAALEPRFISLRYGRPGYGMFSGDVPLAIWNGADNGSQIGVYLQIQESEAVRNVQLRAPEYLPIGLESGIFLHPSRCVLEEAPAPVFVYGKAIHPRGCGCEQEERPQWAGIGGGLM
ncbi:hypothetical protein [Silvibacterium acidisoli]|uniref:hypothetical protein n=1 Tax=Acidobacteriaceae bacterium ZG23-2 TaxID=2883246 RepID=UPI00406D0EC5